MDMLISTLTAEGIPAIILKLALDATGQKGGARLTTALASLGPGGMIGGLITLGVAQAASFFITEKLIEKIFLCVIHQMMKDGTTPDEIVAAINTYKISDGLKERLRKEVSLTHINVLVIE